MAHSDESIHDTYANVNRRIAMKHCGQHGHTLFCESIWAKGPVFQGFEPIAICDEFIGLTLIQLKAEGFRKSSGITLDLFIQSYCLNSIQFRQISVQNDLNVSYCQNTAFDRRLREDIAICDILWSSFRGLLCHRHIPSSLFYPRGNELIVTGGRKLRPPAIGIDV